MPSKTGYWNPNEIENQHVFSFNLARWLGDFLPQEDVVIDMGCGLGDYVDYLSRIGFDATGIEGADLGDAFNSGNIIIHDLTKPIDLGYKGSVITLEVAEHIPSEYMKPYLDNVCKHVKDYLVMSWAVPGQAGFGHVNCLFNLTVVEEMKNRGFSLMYNPTMEARGVIEHYCGWFKNTILIFKNENT